MNVNQICLLCSFAAAQRRTLNKLLYWSVHRIVSLAFHGPQRSRTVGSAKKPLLRVAREHAVARCADSAILCASDPDRVVLLGAAIAAARQAGLDGFFPNDQTPGGP